MRPSGTAAPPATCRADPTRVVQGVVTGVGFLGAGVIMKDGLSISGLTTAASIWAASAIGVLLGVGFYAAALLMALLCMLSMSMLQRLEARLPGRATLEVCLTFGAAGPPTFEELAAQAESRGYRVLHDSLRITFADSRPMWRFCVVALDRARAASPDSLAQEMARTTAWPASASSPCGTDPRRPQLLMSLLNEHCPDRRQRPLLTSNSATRTSA